MKNENSQPKAEPSPAEEVETDKSDKLDAIYAESPRDFNFITLQNNLQNCLSIVDNEVMKNYVSALQNCSVVLIDNATISDLEQIQFFRISELVYQEDEFSVHKLATIFNALSNKPCTLVLMIQSDGQTNDFYLGVRSRDSRFSGGTMRQLLEQSLLGLFPGSKTDDYFNEDMRANLDKLDIGAISSVTCIADYKQDQDSFENKNFIQGLEKFICSMQGKAFTAICIANNLEHNDLENTRKEYERIYTLMSPFANMQYNYALNKSFSISDSDTNGEVETDSDVSTEGVITNQSESDAKNNGKYSANTRTDTQGKSTSVGHVKTHTKGTMDGTSDSENTTKTVGTYAGVGGGFGPVKANAGVTFSVSRGKTHGTSHSDSISDSISQNLTFGINFAKSTGDTEGKIDSHTKTRTIGVGTQYSKNEGHSISTNYAHTKALTDTFGNSQAVTINVQNKSLINTLERLEKQLERLDECESIGMWDFAAYFLGESAAEAETAASMYRSLISGNQSGLEIAAVNTWTDEERVKCISKYVVNFMHPVFLYELADGVVNRQTFVDATALASTNELAIQLGLPRKSVKGLPVIEHALFAQEVLSNNHAKDEEKNIELGVISHFGKDTDTKVELDLESFSMHTFITGSTGSGKSNTVYEMVRQLDNNGINYLIIEPAKGEYKNVFGHSYGVHVYGTNPQYTDLLRINPFRFPEGIHVLEHIDRLVEIFNVCWPMYAAMPAVLKNAIEKSYVDCGWNLVRSKNKYGDDLYPSFVDVTRNIKEIIDTSEYDSENKGAYKGSLLTRLQSLTNGIYGMIFTCDDIEDSLLFDKNVIVDLSRVGSAETKSLIMGMLVLKLQEYRMANATGMNEKLKHVTVLEEAHNLLKRTSTEQSSESANILGKSVEMLTNAIAEMRTYGEGFIIADQAPGLLDLAVIRNTNTKIIMRLPDNSDRELVCRSANLNDDQISEIAKLPCGVAAVYQNDWVQPVLCKVSKFSGATKLYKRNTQDDDYLDDMASEATASLLECIMNRELFGSGNRTEIQRLRKMIIRSELDTAVKKDFIEYIYAEDENAIASLRHLIYRFLSAEKAIKEAAHCNNINDWVQSVVDGFNPSIKEYSKKQIDLVLALVLYEQSLKDSEYNNIFCRFTEIYKVERGVFK